MRVLLIFLLALVSFDGLANEPLKDSLPPKRFIKQLRFHINWMEIGAATYFKGKSLSGLENGLSAYYSGTRTNGHYGLFGLSIYYKEKISLGFICFSRQNTSNNQNYVDYLTNRYSNYYVQSSQEDYSYETTGLAFSASYRKAFRYFYLEPKFRFGLSNLSKDHFYLWMKERGSNQYMELELNENHKTLLKSYHFILAIAHQFKTRAPIKWELGLQSEFFIAPTKTSVTLSEKRYGADAVVSTQNISRLNPALAFSVFLNWKLGR